MYSLQWTILGGSDLKWSDFRVGVYIRVGFTSGEELKRATKTYTIHTTLLARLFFTSDRVVIRGI